MYKKEDIEDFYKKKLGWIPDNFNKQVGHFNVFLLDPYVTEIAKSHPYAKRDFYKIMLVNGGGTVHYADTIIDVQQQVLTFSNPYIPYNWTNRDQIDNCIYCIFNKDFFQQYGDIDQYPVFHPQGNHVFEITNEQTIQVKTIFEKMLVEIQSNYTYKYDVLRNLAFELIHFAMKLEAQPQFNKQEANAAERIKNLFIELLERQFPIDKDHGKINFRTASEFAKQLNIHVNYLNKALKETSQKTTTQIISERILKEAKILLKQTDLNISEIAYALGFSEATHFNNFFKKQTQLTPSKFQ
ncbi:helix-turn-helix transcriptional regulator, partial [Saprospiraceae bacterium]|nr:helix-turn-helix transcriptional regulator [Saprospiraceae bacterium]